MRFLRFLKLNKISTLGLLICFAFFLAYSVLSIVRHQNYNSFAYDLGINTQTVWRYSQFQSPVSTLSPYPDKPKLFLHFELIYALIAPFYWLYSSPITLLVLEIAFLVSGGFAIFLIAKRRLKNNLVSFSILFSYLMFYGVQFAVWTDAHSTGFASGLLAWFLYFVDSKKYKFAFIFFLLSITSKENIAIYTFLISAYYFIKDRQKKLLFPSVFSIFYLFFVFLIFFPFVTQIKYLYQNKDGILSNLNPLYLINTQEKLTTLLYSYGSAGFLSLLSPVSVLLTLAHFFTFFVVASDLPGAHGIFGHYRVTITPFLFFGVILVLKKFKFFNKNYIAFYLLICTLFFQYTLHLPLSYLTKSWFWEKPLSVDNINRVLEKLPENASVVAQNNISPHISHRDRIYLLYPEEKNGKEWFYWYGEPEYLVVDTSDNWDARHLLTDNKKFKNGIYNLKKEGVIDLVERVGDAQIYKILKNP